MHPNLLDCLEGATPEAAAELFSLIERVRLNAASILTPPEESTRPYQHLLRTVGDGVRLTSAGYLPPTVVSALMADLGWNAWWIGKGNREDWTVPIQDLRRSATALGLLRVHRGTLVRTVRGRKATEDATVLWEGIAARITRARYPAERDAITILLLLLAADVARDAKDALHRTARLLELHGWRRPNGGVLHYGNVVELVRDTWIELEFLGVFGDPGRSRLDDQKVTPGGVAFARQALSDPLDPE